MAVEFASEVGLFEGSYPGANQVTDAVVDRADLGIAQMFDLFRRQEDVAELLDPADQIDARQRPPAEAPLQLFKPGSKGRAGSSRNQYLMPTGCITKGLSVRRAACRAISVRPS